MAEMTAEMTGVNVISPTWFSVTDETGTISSLASADYVKLAHDAGREVWGLIDNFNEAFDETTDLAYASVRSRIIEQLLAEAASCGMDGINVDFENLKEAGIPHYLQFLRELTSAAHAQNLVVSVDTPVPQAYTMYYQRGEQARFVDYMIVMAYDEHFAGSEEAGSVSSLPFVQQAVEEMTAGDACRSGDLRNPVLYPCLDGKVRTERHYQRGAGHGWRQKLCQRESDDRNLGCIPWPECGNGRNFRCQIHDLDGG